MQLMHDADNGMVLEMLLDDYVNSLFRLGVINTGDMLAFARNYDNGNPKLKYLLVGSSIIRTRPG